MELQFCDTAFPDVEEPSPRIRLDLKSISTTLGPICTYDGIHRSFLFGLLPAGSTEWIYTHIPLAPADEISAGACCYITVEYISKLRDIGAMKVLSMTKSFSWTLVYQNAFDTKGKYIHTRLIP